MSKGTPVVGDYCDPGNVRRVIGGKSNAIKYCYEKELQTNPNMEGKIVAQWEVGLHGSVVDASISTTTMSSKAVEGCIIRVVKRMRFDKPKGGSCTVSFPFVFAAE